MGGGRGGGEQRGEGKLRKHRRFEFGRNGGGRGAGGVFLLVSSGVYF